MSRKKKTDLTNNFVFVVVLFLSLFISSSLCQSRRQRVSKLDKSFQLPGVNRDPEFEDEDLIVEYQPEDLVSTKIEYNYDFDFELAVLSGLTPKPLKNVNSTTISNSDLSSSPGCPDPYEGRPWVLYGKPKKCYLSGYQWPCPQNMKLLPQRSSVYGYCACNCSAENYGGQAVTAPQSYCLGHTAQGMERVLVYRRTWNGCFPLFEQGKCPDGKWLVMSTESPLRGTFCKTRKCPVAPTSEVNATIPSGNKKFSFYDYRTKSCHTLGDRCNSSNSNPRDGEAVFELSDGDWTPVCTSATNLRSLSHRIGITGGNCSEGQRLSRILGSCIPLFGGGRNNRGVELDNLYY